MPKASRVEYTAMTFNPVNNYDSDMDVHIFDTLSSLSTDWICYYDHNEHYCDRTTIARKVDEGLTVGFGFVRTGSSNSVTYSIRPSVILLQKYLDTPTVTGSHRFDSETHTEIIGAGSSTTPFAFPSPIGPFLYGSPTEEGNMRYTVCEGKNKKAWTVSVVQANKTFDVYSAYVGIDSGGTPYAIAASNVNHDSVKPLAMEFYISNRLMSGSYPSDRSAVDTKTQHQIGFGPNSSNLTLIPLINPFTGATCTDLYIAQSGPRDTMLYDITINGRHFVTGASNNTEPNEGMTIESYQPQFKIFMEV